MGRYRIIEKLGVGAMAGAYKAYDPSADRPLVIKLLRAEMCGNQEARASFRDEAKLVSRLSHPSTARVFDWGEIEGRPFIAMEWLDGRALSVTLEHGRSLPFSDVLDVGIQLANALDYVHGMGIVHGDVKPGNIIRVTSSGVIKLTDFGSARMFGPAARPAGAADPEARPCIHPPPRARPSAARVPHPSATTCFRTVSYGFLFRKRCG